MEGAMLRHYAERMDKTQKYAQAQLDKSIYELINRYNIQEIELLEFLKGMAQNTWCGARNYKRACPEDNHEQAFVHIQRHLGLLAPINAIEMTCNS
jgi:hypothetical protein